jgi:LuxR family maltose regulon positive regulatory protein
MAAREIALSERWDDHSDEVREAGLALSRDPRRRLTLEGTRALGEALAGQPLKAVATASGARGAASISNMTILRTEIALAEAIAHREVGDRVRAMMELNALTVTPVEPMLYARILAYCELAHARIDDGDLETARETFAIAEALVIEERFGPDGRSWLCQVRLRLALAANDLGEARRLAQLETDPFWAAIGVARVDLAAGRRAEAAVALETAAPRCIRHEVIADLLNARSTASHDESLKFVTTAVEKAAATGMLQTVASEGADVLELVERVAVSAPTPWLNRLRRIVASPGAQLNIPNLIEPLTERERDVLRFLPSRLTVREIADELYVSVNTLKFHLKVIYRKLGVSSRAEAAEVARRVSRLPRAR